MDHTAGEDVEGIGAEGAANNDAVEPDPADFSDDLDQLAVIETELAEAEAELEALDSSASAPVSE